MGNSVPYLLLGSRDTVTIKLPHFMDSWGVSHDLEVLV